MVCFIIKQTICKLKKYHTDRTHNSIGSLEGQLQIICKKVRGGACPRVHRGIRPASLLSFIRWTPPPFSQNFNPIRHGPLGAADCRVFRYVQIFTFKMNKCYFKFIFVFVDMCFITHVEMVRDLSLQRVVAPIHNVE